MGTKTYPDILTTTEAMEYLRVTRKTLLKLVHNKTLPAGKVGKDFRYLKSEIDNYLKREETKPNLFLD